MSAKWMRLPHAQMTQCWELNIHTGASDATDVQNNICPNIYTDKKLRDLFLKD